MSIDDEADRLRAENERLRKALEDIERNYDHEDDAHKYNNGACRVCIARDALRTEDGHG